MRNTTVKALLNRWHTLLCESGVNSKKQVRKEIEEVLKKLEENAINESNKKYKIFFKNNELIQFSTLEKCKSCIETLLKIVGDKFTKKDFEIYGLIENR